MASPPPYFTAIPLSPLTIASITPSAAPSPAPPPSSAAGVSTGAPKSPIIPDSGEFLMEVSLGTPPVNFVGIADTGSDLTWTQCLPCPDMSSAVKGGLGNIIIDSGTTLTYLPHDLYDRVVSTLGRVIRAKRVEDPVGMLKLCYATDEIGDGDIPTITAHFGGGAAVKLLPLNTFREVAKNVSCLTFAPSKLAIFGNLAQMNFLVGYDLHARRLSFKPTVCA